MPNSRTEDRNVMQSLRDRMEALSEQFEKASVAEFIELYRQPWKMILLNFVYGMVRGFGIAIGFSVVGALFLYLLGRAASLNLPIIGEFVAEIARIVEMELKLN